MSIRKLGVCVATVLALAAPLAAQASTSRLQGMSLPGDYTTDYTAIYGWPSSITGVGSLVYGEVGSFRPQLAPAAGGNALSERAMGTVLPNLWEGRFGVWALHLRELTPALGQGDAQTAPGTGNAFDPNLHANQSIDLGWGKKFGTKSLGLRLTHSNNSLVEEVPGTTLTFKQDDALNSIIDTGNPSQRRNVTGLGGGLGFDMNAKTTAEVSFLFESRTFENSASGTGAFKNHEKASGNFLVAGRLMHKAAPNLTLFPVVKYYSYDLSTTHDVTGPPAVTVDSTNTMKGWQVGLAGNWTLGSNDLFVLGATVAQNKLDQQADLFGFVGDINGEGPLAPFNAKATITETLMPQVFMALETPVNNWLTLRVGANKTLFRTVKVEGTTGAGAGKVNETLTYKDSPFSMNAGAGVKVGSLRFDAVLDANFFTNPVAQVLGNQNANYSGNSGTVFSKVSMTYNW